jgi:sarcosine oxidase, subunit beta
VGEVCAQVAERFPPYEMAGMDSLWTGVYDVTPDRNPVPGPLADIEGLVAPFGFSGHGFRLSPGIGKILA